MPKNTTAIKSTTNPTKAICFANAICLLAIPEVPYGEGMLGCLFKTRRFYPIFFSIWLVRITGKVLDRFNFSENIQ